MQSSEILDVTLNEPDNEIFSDIIEFLKEGGSAQVKKQIKYFTLGSDRWNVTDEWPPEGFTPETWYFGADNDLSTELPQKNEGADSYTINYEATTGRRNRWFTNGGGGDVIYPDRAKEEI